MPLPLVVDSIEGLPEPIAKEYSEKEGKFYLQATPAEGLSVENVAPLKKTLETVRGELRQAQEKLKAFEGIEDPDVAREAVAKFDEMKNWTPDVKVKEQIEALKKDLVTKHGQELEDAKKRAERIYKQLEQNMLHRAAQEALISAGAGKRAKLAMPHLLQQLKMRDSNGQYIVEVVDENGNGRVGDAQGNPMTIPQLVEEMKGMDDFAPVFDGSGSSGSGNTPPNKPGGAPGSRKTVSPEDGVLRGIDPEKIIKGEVEVKIGA